MNATQYSSGQGTASGEPFRPDSLTAAHRKLPFGTRVKVTNPRTGATTIVKINDRGPFAANRILDVSHKVAETLDFHRKESVCGDHRQ